MDTLILSMFLSPIFTVITVWNTEETGDNYGGWCNETNDQQILNDVNFVT